MTENRTCQNCKSQFVIEPEDFDFYEKIGVPAPTWCIQCRAIRRMMWWNEHNLYREKDDLTGKEIFSTYPESSPVKIYDRDYWWSDAWDPMDYGREHDPGRSFFEQMHELALDVPWPSRDVQRLTNSDYSNQAEGLKNCYLCFNAGMSENCLYGVSSLQMRDSLDFYFCGFTELSYEIMNADNCYAIYFSTDVTNCRNVWFSRDCHDCSDCFGCANLRSKQYYIFNEPYRKEEYIAKLKEMNCGSYAKLCDIQRRTYGFWKSQPYRFAHQIQVVRSTGDYIYNAKNVRQCYQVLDAENLAYCQNMSRGIKDSMDYTSWGNNAELIYESINVGENIRNLKFCFNCWPGCSDLEYCINCISSSNCFGCVGLKKKEYCILNKQYTKEEYEKLKSLVIQHMRDSSTYGEFFPPEHSPLAYNESVAINYFPKTKERAIAEGYPWRDPVDTEYKITMQSGELPDHIKDVAENITEEVIECAACKRAYRALARELEFYKRFNIALPRLCHRCRYVERIKRRNPMLWFHRRCMCTGALLYDRGGMLPVYQNTAEHFHGDQPCENEFETTFGPDRPEIIYCEECYRAEVM